VLQQIPPTYQRRSYNKLISTQLPQGNYAQKLEPDSALIEETLAAKDGFYEPAQIIEPVEAVEKEPLREVTTQDTSKLTLRQCRAVIREINKGLPKEERIRQKINGKDAPTDWLRVRLLVI
jgi:hypothetical protein